MKKFFFFTLILVYLLGSLQVSAWALDIVVVQSARIEAYNETVSGFTSVISHDIPATGPKSIQSFSLTYHDLSEADSQSRLRQNIIRKRPDLILVIGSSSLSLFKDIRDIPIIYSMVPFPDMIVKEQANIGGILLDITPEQQLEALTRKIPRINNIGLLYDPKRSGKFVSEARTYAGKNKLSLITLPVEAPRQVSMQLEKLKDGIDCFWMLPDRTVVTPETVDLIMLYSLENNIPVFAFAEKYLQIGAVLSVSFDPYDIGRQAGEMALDIIKKGKTKYLKSYKIRKVNIRVNHTAAKTLGVLIDDTGDQM